MPFDPMSWALGFSFTKTATWLLNKADADDLPARLLKVVGKWGEEAPETQTVWAEALFPSLLEVIPDRPDLKSLRETLEKDEAPTHQQWHAALMEHWRIVGREPHRDSFFYLDEGIATSLLDDLAERIWKECLRDPRLFPPTVMIKLKEIHAFLLDHSKQQDELVPVRNILQECYRRSIFTTTNAQTSFEAMVASIAECRSRVQAEVGKIQTKAMSQAASDVNAGLDFLEQTARAKKPPEEIDTVKKKVLDRIGKLSDLSGIPYSIPRGLAPGLYFSKTEADEPPA